MRRWLIGGALLLLSSGAWAQQQESRADAWWTGPMLAANGASMPQGHLLVEPYLFDVVSSGAIDADGNRHSLPTQQSLGSLTYLLYGLTNNIGVGLLPRFQYNIAVDGRDSSQVGLGDLTLQASYGLLHFHDGRSIPDLSFVVQETLPTGRYDHLGRLSDGIGAGAYSTALALYAQDYFWLPNGRILRARLDLTYTLSSSTSVNGLSVYGTAPGFSGRAYPGDAFNADAAAEYSLTRNWVLALDVVYAHNDNTGVSGSIAGTAPAPPSGPVLPTQVHTDSGDSWSLGFAPALEYNFTSAVGVLLGVRIIEIGRNTSTSITPAVAVNMVF